MLLPDIWLTFAKSAFWRTRGRFQIGFWVKNVQLYRWPKCMAKNKSFFFWFFPSLFSFPFTPPFFWQFQDFLFTMRFRGQIEWPWVYTPKRESHGQNVRVGRSDTRHLPFQRDLRSRHLKMSPTGKYWIRRLLAKTKWPHCVIMIMIMSLWFLRSHYN